MQYEPHTRRSPAGTGLRRKMQSAGLRGHCSTATAPGNPAQALLSRLDGVKKAGRGWIARCPAHEDRRASLSIAEGDDGRALVHCFGGCSAADVMAAAGLALSDLYAAPIDRGHLSPTQRRAVTAETRIARQWAALQAALPSLAVVEVAAGMVAAGEALDATDAARVRQAVQQIHDVRVGVQRMAA